MSYSSVDFVPTISMHMDSHLGPAATASSPLQRKQDTAQQHYANHPRFTDEMEAVLHSSTPSAMQPKAMLSCWGFYRVSFEDGGSSTHLAGLSNGSARVTTAVHSVHPFNNRVVTETGRTYVLEKEHGYSIYVDAVLDAWLRVNRAKRVLNQTGDFLEMQRLARRFDKCLDAHAHRRFLNMPDSR